MEKGERGNIYYLTILGLNAFLFLPDREHNELPLENWMLCEEITTVCCETNMVSTHTHTHRFIYIYIYIMCTKKQGSDFWYANQPLVFRG